MMLTIGSFQLIDFDRVKTPVKIALLKKTYGRTEAVFALLGIGI